MNGLELKQRLVVHLGENARCAWRGARPWYGGSVDATDRFAKWLGVSRRTVQRAYNAHTVPEYMRLAVRLLDWAETEGITLPLELCPPADG